VAPAFNPANLRLSHDLVVEVLNSVIATIKARGPHTPIDMADLALRCAPRPLPHGAMCPDVMADLALRCAPRPLHMASCVVMSWLTWR
jgi:hypothetical protein